MKRIPGKVVILGHGPEVGAQLVCMRKSRRLIWLKGVIQEKSSRRCGHRGKQWEGLGCLGPVNH